MARQVGMFDVEERLAGLSKKGDDLERLGAVVEFELFRPELERAAPRADGGRGGRPPFDYVQPAKLRQKDRDARWTVKMTKAKPREGETPLVDLAIPAFGYQNHISADRRHRLIRRWLVTDAAAHAGARLDVLLPDNTASAVW